VSNAKPVILVTYDGSDVSKAVFEPAARIAKLMQAMIALVRVMRVPPEIWSHPDAAYREREIAALNAEIERETDAAAAELSSAHGIEATGQARLLGERWNVAAEILAAADDVGADIICMATHGEGGIRRLFLGSTTQEVIAESKRPVMLVRAGDEA
jgi:nucleotide-binding universal stress UspA family protein